ncbi:MAG: hypothetical protein AB7T49_18470 [Oligoflexales bacterium]
MKHKVLKLLLAMSALSISMTGQAQSWEYLKVINTPETMSVEYLNQLGRDCWELTSCPSDSVTYGPIVYLEDGQSFYPYAYDVANYCIFKRKTTRVSATDKSSDEMSAQKCLH